MLRRIPIGLLSVALVALALVARVPRTAPGTAEAAGPVASITLSVSSTAVVCGYTSTIVATLKDAGGNVVDEGTIVTFTASNGAIQPSAVTNTGRAIVGLNSAYVSGAVTVTASSGGKTAQATVPVSCGLACGLVNGCLGGCALLNACGSVCGYQVTTCAPACGTTVPNCSVCLGAPCYGTNCAYTVSCVGSLCGINAGCIGNSGCVYATACYGCGGVLCGGVCGVALGCGAVYAPIYAPVLAPVVIVSAGPGALPSVGSLGFLAYPKTGSCGSTLSITILATIAGGQPAANGTAIGLTTNLGAVEKQVTTFGGQAVARLTIDPKVSGSATITATAPNGVTATETLPITCA